MTPKNITNQIFFYYFGNYCSLNSSLNFDVIILQFEPKVFKSMHNAKSIHFFKLEIKLNLKLVNS